MPNPDYTLDSEELARYQAWATEHWRHGPCPVCQAKNWQRNERIGYLQNPQTAVDGTAYYILPIYCGTCGYTVFINAWIAGIKKKPDAKPVPPQ